MTQNGPEAGGEVANSAPLTPAFTHHLLSKEAGGATLSVSG